MLKGYLCTIETSCIHSLDTVETVFIPSRNLEAVKNMVRLLWYAFNV